MKQIAADTIIQMIGASSMPAETKESLSKLSATLGSYTLTYLQKQIQKNLSLFSDAQFVKAQEDIFSAYNSLVKSGDTLRLIEIIKKAPSDPLYDFGNYVLPIILDIKSLENKNQIQINPELWNAMNGIEALVFEELPQEEVISILKSNLLFFLGKVDMVFQLKRRYVLDDGDFVENWGVPFLQALKNNEEVLGSGNIMVDNRGMPPFVKNWIQDFISFLPTPIAQRSALEEAQYFSKSPNLKVLTSEDKRVLQELLQLHDWLLHPSGTFEELDILEPKPRVSSEAVAAPATPQAVANIQDILTNKTDRLASNGMRPSGIFNQVRRPAEGSPKPSQPSLKQPRMDDIQRKLDQLKARVESK